MPPAVTIMPSAADDLGARANDDVHARLHIGVAGLADLDDAACLDTDVGLDDAPVVQDQGVGQARNRRRPWRQGRWPPGSTHAVADGLAAAELHFFTVAAGAQGVVLLDFKDQVGVGQTQAVTHGGA